MTFPIAPSPTESEASSAAPLSSLDDQDRLATRLIHVGSHPDPLTGAVIPPISLSTTYAQTAPGVPIGPFDYSRAGNPNRVMLENLVASLEVPRREGIEVREQSGHPDDEPLAVAFSSGTAATAAVINGLVGSGNHLVSVGDVYGGTNRYFTKVAALHGIETTFVDMSSRPCKTKEQEATEADRLVRAISGAFRHNTKMVWIETPTNPTLRLVDIAFVSHLAHSKGALALVDNTFLSPYFQRPLEHGADLVLHSATKYLNGHSDVVLGLVATARRDLASALHFAQKAVGAVPSPFDCWLAMRGAKTLQVRMQAHGRNALALAQHLSADPRVDFVKYHGLSTAPGRHLAWRQLSREATEWIEAEGYTTETGFPYGGMLTFRLKVPESDAGEAAARFLQNCRIFTLAESLGGVESLAELPSVMTHASITAEERAALGIDHALIRLSVGIEDIRDLIKDVDRGLAAAFP